MMQLLISACLIIITLAQGDTLLQVQILWRHGARYPIHCNWGCETYKDNFEKLTPTGMRQQYYLGQWLRKRYIDEVDETKGFLPQKFNENIMYVQTTDVNRQPYISSRTIMSAYSNLQGMYPSTTGPNVPAVDQSYLLPPIEDILTPPIFDQSQAALPHNIQLLPIHMKEGIDDKVLKGYGSPTCKKADEFQTKNKQSDLYKSVNSNEKVQKLIAKFTEEVKPTETTLNISNLFQYTDTFYSDKWNAFPLPAGLTEDTFKELDKLAPLTFQLEWFQTWEQVRLLSSPFMHNTIHNMHTFLNGTNKYKYLAYSAHDTTVQLILSALNLTSSECIKQAYFGEKVDNKNCIYTVMYIIIKYPGYASNIIFELYNTTRNTQYVKVMVNGTYVNICSGGGTTCEFWNFHDTIKTQVVDFEAGCGMAVSVKTNYETPGWAIAFFVIIILLLCAAGATVFYLHRRLKSVGFTSLSSIS